MAIFTQIIILLVVLACMVMLLLGIRQLTHIEGFEDAEETSHLKEEVEEDDHVLSRNNIFSSLVEAEPVESEEHHRKSQFKGKSKDPLSRKE
ncbi:MAG: hypothetical protein J1F43_04955 [Muribaculaceae bacterium]|nr:hypothetical protein [Muribaculaceae bacterium]